MAIRFALEGARVVVADVNVRPKWAPEGDDPTVDVIERSGGAALYVNADVTRPEDVHHLLGTAVGWTGRLDVVVNNAGVFGSSSILDTTDEEWERYMALNLTSQFLVCRRAVELMVSQEPRLGVRGRIVNVSSQLGMTGPPGRCAYAVSKAGVAQLTRQLAVDYARDGHHHKRGCARPHHYRDS